MNRVKREPFSVLTFLALVVVWSAAAIGAAQDKPATAPEVQAISEVEELRLTVQIKDFQLAQVKFAGTIAEIKKAHGWGDDVLYDANQNKFYRVGKPAAKAEAKKPEKK